MRLIIPSIGFLFKLALIPREIFHQLKHGLPLRFKVSRVLLALGKPVHHFLEFSARPLRAAERFKGVPDGLRKSLPPCSTCHKTDLGFQAALHSALTLLVKRSIAERLSLLNPKRSPDTRLAAAAAAGEAEQALQFSLRCVVLEQPVI